MGRYSVKKIKIKTEDFLFEISSVNMHLKDTSECIEVKFKNKDIVLEIIEEDSSDIYFDENELRNPIRIFENLDYWIKINTNRLENSNLFIKSFINKISTKEKDKLYGIFNSKNYVGILNLECFNIIDSLIEIETKKLNYYNDYSNLIEDISNFFCELISRSSSFFETRLQKSDSFSDEVKYYTQFAFIKNLLHVDNLPNWIDYIINQPHSLLEGYKEEEFIWDIEELEIDDYLNAIGDSSNRLEECGNESFLICEPKYLTMYVDTQKYTETIDTKENRFVKFFLKYLMTILSEISKEVNEKSKKLKEEILETSLLIEEKYDMTFFSSISNLRSIPFSSQILQRKYPYNKIFKAYNEVLLSSKISIDIFDEGFCVGQKDVPKLYEYWVFIRIFQALNALFNNNFIVGNWIEYNKGNLNVTLSSGVNKFVVYTIQEDLKLKLYYNKEYNSDKYIFQGRSYGNKFDPDVSIEILKDDKLFGIIHFDAKYKLEEDGSAKKEDINKMHTYKDAIMGTVGAYVVNPGKEKELFIQEEKIVNDLEKTYFPSVGAFPLNIVGNNAEIDNIIKIIKEFINIAITNENLANFSKENITSYKGIQRIIGQI